ncbi:hypothetical protein BP00DRAFT_35506 [Aspergillus indologenus CBS 114.80]|uniref:Uncharacterized protein n=1 Tax=Aspergillus indologenus CBS 114.80 TaxID=1450541 RepID=A0A2V5HRM8_9EURO|nr:hypothetical protein BP00DRAFT_35506 [Aspergillus indologenus CBS 114.80]
MIHILSCIDGSLDTRDIYVHFLSFFLYIVFICPRVSLGSILGGIPRGSRHDTTFFFLFGPASILNQRIALCIHRQFPLLVPFGSLGSCEPGSVSLDQLLL